MLVVLFLAGPGLGLAAAQENYLFLPLILSGAPQETCPAPTLVSPADGSPLDTLIPFFQWDRGANPLATQLTLDVSTDAAFANIQHRYTTTSAHWTDEFRFPRNLDEGSTYYWRTYVICGAGDPVYSGVWTLNTPTNVPRLGAPGLVAPADMSTLSGASVTYEWAAVNGALEYLVKWQKVGTSTTSSKYVPATQLSYATSSLSGASEYEWWVSAVDAGAIGAESAHWHFYTP